MIEDIQFISNKRNRSEIQLHHSSGEVTCLHFLTSFPLQAQDYYVNAIKELLNKNGDISPKEDLFGLFVWWFSRYSLETPVSVFTYIDNERQRIGRRIKELREEQNIEANRLADTVGIDAANLCRIEQGKHSVGIDILSKIANALGYKIELVKM